MPHLGVSCHVVLGWEGVEYLSPTHFIHLKKILEIIVDLHVVVRNNT